MKKLAIAIAAAALGAEAAFAGETVVTVESGTKTIVEALGEGFEYPSGNRLVKKGAGTLTITTSLYDGVIANMTVEAGTIVVNDNNRLGQTTYAGDNIIVKSGATMDFSGPNPLWLNNRCVKVEGAGAEGMGGALVFSVQGYMQYFQPQLTGDATFLNKGERHCQIFNEIDTKHPARIKLGKHTLTLKSSCAYGYALRTQLYVPESGTIVLDGTCLNHSNPNTAFNAIREAGTKVTLVMKNNGYLTAGNPGVFGLFDEIEIQEGSYVKGNATADFAATVGSLAGCGSITTGFSSLTVTNELKVSVADLKAGKTLAVTPATTFSESTLVIDGDLKELYGDADGIVPIFTCENEITGMPAWTSPSKYWTLEKSADGKTLQLKLSYAVPSGAIDVRKEWGITPTSAAADNSSAFKSKLAALADGAVTLFFAPGDYPFFEALDLSRGNVTLLGCGRDTFLRVGDSVANVVTAKSAANVTITAITLAGSTGAAVSASATSRLTVTNAYFTAINGAYPVVVTGASTDTMVRRNRMTGGLLVEGPASIEGTKQSGCEPITGEFHVWVGPDETEDLGTCVVEAGRLITKFPSDCRLFKEGPGTLVGTNLYFDGGSTAAMDDKMKGIDIVEGVYAVRRYQDFGRNCWASGDQVYIRDGATLLVEGTEDAFVNKVFGITGSGAPGMGGAIVIRNANAMNRFGQFTLRGDAVIAADIPGKYCKFLNYVGIGKNYFNLNGHNLKFVGLNGTPGYEIATSLNPSGTGDIIFDGVGLKQTTDAFEFSSNTRHIRLVLQNGAEMSLRNGNVLPLAESVKCDVDSSITFQGSVLDSYDWPLTSWEGAGTVAQGIAIALSDSYVASVEAIKAGTPLTTGGSLTFGANCTLSFDGQLSGALGDKITAAKTAETLASRPTLAPAYAKHWAVNAEAGTDLKLDYSSGKPEGAIDVVAEWGIVAGSESASDNSLKFSTEFDKLEDGGHVLFFRDGEYHFSGALEINKPGVTLMGIDGECKLHASVTVAADDVTVTGLTLGDVDGVAVYAGNAARVSVSNNLYYSVGGAITDVAGTYPVHVSGCGDAMVRLNRVTDGRYYTECAYYDNGSTKASGCEPVDGEFHVWVDAGASETYAEAFAKTGYETYPSNAHLFKHGPGILVGQAGYSTKGKNNILGITICEGILSIGSQNELGLKDYAVKDPLYILDGATLRCTNASGSTLANQVVRLQGEGAFGEGGAIVFYGKGATEYGQLRLDGDATVVTRDGIASGAYKNYSYMFWNQNTGIKVANQFCFNGHTLRVKAAGDCKGYILSDWINFSYAGTLIMDGCELKQVSEVLQQTECYKADVTLKLVNGAKFLPINTVSTTLFTGYDLEHGTSIEPVDAAFEMSVAKLAGAGTIGAFTSFTVTTLCTLRAEELNAGYGFAASCPFIFGDNAKLDIDSGAALGLDEDSYDAVTSTISVTGTPKALSVKRFAGWSIVKGDAKLSLAHPRGLSMYIK